MRKKLLLSILALLLVASLGGCGKSKAATAVDDMILAIGEVDISSEAAIIDAESSYAALDSEDKSMVENYSVLEQARKSFDSIKAATAVDDMILAIGEVDISSEAAIIDAESSYAALDSEDKSMVKNYSVLEQARKSFDSIKAESERKEKNEATLQELMQNILSLKSLKVSEKSEIDSILKKINALYSSLDEDYQEEASQYQNQNLDSCIKTCVMNSVRSLATESKILSATVLLEEYKDYLDESEKLSCLGDIGLYSCIEDARSDLMRINSGKVFNITKIKAHCTDEAGNKTSYHEGENQVEGELDISGTNYFGGPYTQTIDMFYTFKIDIEGCSVYDLDGFTY